jgi:hypothetical protein
MSGMAFAPSFSQAIARSKGDITMFVLIAEYEEVSPIVRVFPNFDVAESNLNVMVENDRNRFVKKYSITKLEPGIECRPFISGRQYLYNNEGALIGKMGE